MKLSNKKWKRKYAIKRISRSAYRISILLIKSRKSKMKNMLIAINKWLTCDLVPLLYLYLFDQWIGIPIKKKQSDCVCKKSLKPLCDIKVNSFIAIKRHLFPGLLIINQKDLSRHFLPARYQSFFENRRILELFFMHFSLSSYIDCARKMKAIFKSVNVCQIHQTIHQNWTCHPCSLAS